MDTAGPGSVIGCAAGSHAEIERVLNLQRANRTALKASTAAERKARLSKLRAAIAAHASEIDSTLFLDLRKPRLGARHFEITAVFEEIDVALHELEQWMKPEEVTPSPRFQGNKAYVVNEMQPNTSAISAKISREVFPENEVVTINGVMTHYAESRLPFGGVNNSGIGRCKGIHGFRELSNGRSVFVHL
jgi:aldehyde dehydrogenase (NAD+)